MTISATSSAVIHPLQRLRLPSAALLERELGRDPARADVRAANALLAELVVERAREAHLAELRGAVDGFVREPAPAGLGGEGDDVRGVALQQMRQRGTHRVQRPLQVDVDHLFEELGLQLQERPVGADARVRDDDVELPEALDRRGDRRVDLFVFADVAGEPVGGVAEAEVVAAPGGEPDLHARGDERATATPIPPPAPVTNATLPSRLRTPPVVVVPGTGT